MQQHNIGIQKRKHKPGPKTQHFCVFAAVPVPAKTKTSPLLHHQKHKHNTVLHKSKCKLKLENTQIQKEKTKPSWNFSLYTWTMTGIWVSTTLVASLPNEPISPSFTQPHKKTNSKWAPIYSKMSSCQYNSPTYNPKFRFQTLPRNCLVI